MPISDRSIPDGLLGDCRTPRATDAPAGAHNKTSIDEIVTELGRRSEDANAALMNGDIKRYRALVPHADDYVLMSPFGGKPTRGSDLSEESWDAVGRFFRNGSFEQNMIQTYSSPDMIVLVTQERCRVEAGDLPIQDWLLRVTLVYRRERSLWRLVHRHADPLVNGISLEQAAALARG